MKKEYTKMTRQVYNEYMEPTGEVEEIIITSVIADTGKVFKCLSNGFVGGTRIDIGTGDSEKNYKEIEAPGHPQIQNIEQETAGKTTINERDAILATESNPTTDKSLPNRLFLKQFINKLRYKQTI